MGAPWAEVSGSFVLPFIWGAATPAPAVPGVRAQRGLLIGQALSGTGTAFQVTSADQVASLCGRGSVLHRMAMKALRKHSTGLWYGLGVADGAGAAREMTATFTASASAEAGPCRIRIGSDYVDVALPAYDTSTAATAHAGALACDAAFPAVSDLVFKSKAAAVLGVATIVCRHLGTVGNQVRIALDEDLPLPTGWTCTIAQSVAGATDPTFGSTQISQMGASTRWNKVAVWLDAFSSTVGAEMVSRWGWERQLRGHAFSAKADTYANHVTDLTTSPRTQATLTRCLTETGCRAPAFEIAATMTAVCMRSDEAKPGLKVGPLVLTDCQAARPGSEFSPAERNLLTYYGGTTFHDVGGELAIDKAVTTRYQNAYGARDTRAYSATKMWLVDYLMTDWSDTMSILYEQVRLLADREGRLPDGCVSPRIIEDDSVSWYKRHYGTGLVDKLDEFAANIQALIPAENDERVDIRLPLEVARNLDMLAPLFTF